MNLALLEDLKEKLKTATRFDSVFTYFLDHFGEDREFLELGEIVKIPELEVAVEVVGEQMIGKKARVANALFRRLAEQKFVHGACTIGGKPANLLYFEDIGTGMLCVMLSMKGPTQLARFKGPILTNWTPSVN